MILDEDSEEELEYLLDAHLHFKQECEKHRGTCKRVDIASAEREKVSGKYYKIFPEEIINVLFFSLATFMNNNVAAMASNSRISTKEFRMETRGNNVTRQRQWANQCDDWWRPHAPKHAKVAQPDSN